MGLVNMGGRQTSSRLAPRASGEKQPPCAFGVEPLPPRSRFRVRDAAVLAAITLLLFSSTLSGEFVYDARLQIGTDPFLHDPANWLDVLSFRVLARDVLDFNRPVHLASLMLDAAAWGKEPFGYHLTSVLLHAANVVLVWAVGRKLFAAAAQGDGTTHDLGDGGQPRLAATLASMLPPLVFAVHPVVAEAVCEPTFREDLLVAFFTLSGLLLAMGHRPADGNDGWRAAGCVACSLLAIGSKESGIAAPAAITVYWLLFRRGERGWFWPVAIGGAKLVVVSFLAARFLLEPSPSKIFESRPAYPGGSLAAAMLIEPRILALYAQLVLLPMNLCADYGIHSVAHLPLPVAIAVVAGVVAAGVFAVRKDHRMAIAAVLVVVPLLPVLNILPIYKAAADRYLYLPVAGVALAVGLLLDGSWLARRPAIRERLLIGALVAVVLLGIGCMERQRVWANPLALWTDTFQKNPVGFNAASGLAEALRDSGRLPEAEEAARRAIQLAKGKRGETWATLALILDGQGRTKEAFEALDKAVEIDPRLADPEGRVRDLAMERPYADDLAELLARRNTAR